MKILYYPSENENLANSSVRPRPQYTPHLDSHHPVHYFLRYFMFNDSSDSESRFLEESLDIYTRLKTQFGQNPSKKAAIKAENPLIKIYGTQSRPPNYTKTCRIM